MTFNIHNVQSSKSTQLKQLKELTSGRQTSLMKGVEKMLEKGQSAVDVALSSFAGELTDLLKSFNQM